MIGETFGDLTVGRLAGINHRRERLWLCRCTCDGAALRTTDALRSSVRRGTVPCCARCHREVWAGARIARRSDHVAEWVKLWEQHRTLWTSAALDRIERDVRAKVGAELGGFDERVALPVETVDADEGIGERALGDPDEETLHDIGVAIGVSRERARQIISAALRSFATAWGTMFPRDDLRALVTGDERDRKIRGVVRAVSLEAAIAAAARSEAA